MLFSSHTRRLVYIALPHEIIVFDTALQVIIISPSSSPFLFSSCSNMVRPTLAELCKKRIGHHSARSCYARAKQILFFVCMLTEGKYRRSLAFA